MLSINSLLKPLRTAALLVLFPAGMQAQTFLERYNWLAGSWVQAGKKSTVLEEWKIKDDSTMTGVSYLEKNNGKRLELERIELRKRSGKVFYVPLVQGQNNNQEVLFELTAAESEKFTAKNEQHDFPQIISYRLLNKDELSASIEGKIKGKSRREEWRFKKR